MIKLWMLIDFMHNVTCRRKVIKDNSGGRNFFFKGGKKAYITKVRENVNVYEKIYILMFTNVYIFISML